MPTKKYNNLLSWNTPLVFSDGTKIYEKLAEKYIRHKIGFFILAPSGSGKTYFVERQEKMHWLDGDDLWMSTNAHPSEEWWTGGQDTFLDIDQRSDMITVEAKKLGFWIIGASNIWLKPDAIVVPDWETHKKWISLRENTVYDGGVTTDKLNNVLEHRKRVMEWEEKGVPKFKSVSDATLFLTSKQTV